MAANKPHPKSGTDPREIPSYGVLEAARYLSVSRTTLQSWISGAQPLIALPDPACSILSFINLVEAHVLYVIRRRHGIKMRKIRSAIEYVSHTLCAEHPLAVEQFKTDGLDLFIERGVLINVSRGGQLEMKRFIEEHLQRVEYDENKLAARLFPFTRRHDPGEPKIISIDPRISFGRPVINGTGVPTFIVAERFKAGESTGDLARDYQVKEDDIAEAIRYELRLQEAA